MMDTFSLWEGQFLLWIQNHLRSEMLDAFFSRFTDIGEAGVLWILLGLVLLCFSKTRQAGFAVLLGLLACLVLNEGVLKNLVRRPRPFCHLEELVILIEAPGSYSFPSGHAATSLAAATAVLLRHRRLGIGVLAVALLMAFSRLYVGVHYPLDVIFGCVMGVFCGGAVPNAMLGTFAKWRQKKAQRGHAE